MTHRNPTLAPKPKTQEPASEQGWGTRHSREGEKKNKHKAWATRPDLNTTAEDMFRQGKEMFTWVPNAYIIAGYGSTSRSPEAGAVKENLNWAHGMV